MTPDEELAEIQATAEGALSWFAGYTNLFPDGEQRRVTRQEDDVWLIEPVSGGSAQERRVRIQIVVEDADAPAEQVSQPALEASAVTVWSAAELRALLMAACPPGPSLHPKAPSRHPNARDTWNGWNQAHASGIDADGTPMRAYVSAYASGHHDLSVGKLTSIPHGSVTDKELEKRTGLQLPFQVFPPIPLVLHPEHTPAPVDTTWQDDAPPPAGTA